MLGECCMRALTSLFNTCNNSMQKFCEGQKQEGSKYGTEQTYLQRALLTLLNTASQ